MDSRSPYPPAGGPSFTIALVDDDPDSVFLVKRQLLRSAPRAAIAVFTSRDVAAGLSSSAPNVFLVAYRLLGVSGLRMLELLRQQYPRVPLILMSEVALRADEAMRANADHCLTYGDDEALASELAALMRAGPAPSRRPLVARHRHVA